MTARILREVEKKGLYLACTWNELSSDRVMEGEVLRGGDGRCQMRGWIG